MSSDSDDSEGFDALEAFERIQRDFSDVVIDGDRWEEPAPCVRAISPRHYVMALQYLSKTYPEMSHRTQACLQFVVDMAPASSGAWSLLQQQTLLPLSAGVSVADATNIVAHALSSNTPILFRHPKSFQAWHYRRGLLNAFHISFPEAGAPFEEQRVCHEIISGEDPRNYLSWSQRWWFLSTFNLVSEAEIEYTASLLLQQHLAQVNSIWAHRFYVWQWLCERGVVCSAGLLEAEAAFVSRFPECPAITSYINGLRSTWS